MDKRIITVPILLLLAGLGWYNNRKYRTEEITLDKCIKEPQKYHRAEIRLIQDAKITALSETGFTIISRGITIPVIPDPSGSFEKISGENTGDYISVLAHFHRNGFLIPVNYHIHRHRRWKMATSIISVVIILILFFRAFRYSFRTFFFEEKKCPTC